MAAKPQTEENVGPSLDSDNPEERIAARRARIKRRIEEAKRAALGELIEEKKEEIVIRPSDTQINLSRQRLVKLTADGNEIITNIRIAADARESTRRVEEDESRRQRIDKIESERKSCGEKMAEITRKWESALQKEIPEDLRKMLQQQQVSCDSLIEEKNKLISDFRAELTNCDLAYARDLKRWAQDIDLLVERMETQFRTAALTYRQELLQIEHAFDAERTDVLTKHENEWTATIDRKRQMEEDFLKQRAKIVDEFDTQLDLMRRQDAEDYNIVKAKLESEVQLLEQQLQLMKATYQLNQEKLEYNMQVLKKREEENVVTINLQKRKLTKLHDTLNRLQQKLEKQEKGFHDENEQLSGDYQRISDLLQQLMHKANQFVQADNEKFREVWLMNEEECKNLVKRLVEMLQIITEQQLGLPYEAHELTFITAEGRPETTPKQRSANEIVRSVMADVKDASSKLIPTEQAAGKVILHLGGLDGSEQVEITSTTVKRILELICDESGFLIEEKLKRLLAPLDKDDRNLIKLDAIFHALRIENEEDVGILAKYFIQMQKKSEAAAGGCGGGGEAELGEETQRIDGIDEGDQLSPMIEDADRELSSSPSDQPVELIHPNGTLLAMRGFIDEFQRYRDATMAAGRNNKQSTEFRLSLGENVVTRDKARDTAFWQQFAAYPQQKDEQVWDALVVAFDKYHSQLEARTNLIRETDQMRQQNNELRMLLHQYLQAKVNQDLVVPPAKVMQFDATTMPSSLPSGISTSSPSAAAAITQQVIGAITSLTPSTMQAVPSSLSVGR